MIRSIMSTYVASTVMSRSPITCLKINFLTSDTHTILKCRGVLAQLGIRMHNLDHATMGNSLCSSVQCDDRKILAARILGTFRLKDTGDTLGAKS